MARAESEAELPAKDSGNGEEASTFVPREQSPQQAAAAAPQEPPATAAKQPRLAQQTVLAKLIKDLGHESDPALRDAARSRKKNLKAVLLCLQNPKSNQEEKQQLLIKTLIAQANETAKLERLIIPTLQKCDTAERTRSSAEAELAKKKVISEKLQDLCRSLQSSNNFYKEQLEKQQSIDEAERERNDSLQQAISSITARLDDEKDKLGHLEDLTVQNSQLKERIATMGHQIELQQKLSEQQDLQRKTLREMLTKQEAESTARQGEALDHMQKLQQQNETQAELLGKQEALLERQGGQTEECNQRIRAAREDLEKYQRTVKAKQREIGVLTAEVQERRKLHKLLQQEYGQNVVEGIRRVQAHKAALENLCRALQEDNRKLKSAASLAETGVNSEATATIDSQSGDSKQSVQEIQETEMKGEVAAGDGKLEDEVDTAGPDGIV